MKRKEKKFYRLVNVELNTEQAAKGLKDFPYLSAATYFLYVKAPYYAQQKPKDDDKFYLTEELLESSYSYVGKILIDSANRLSEEVSRLNILIKEKESELGSITYSSTSTEVKIYAPVANNFLQVIKELDKVVMMTDLLWFDGHINEKERNENIGFFSKKVNNNMQKIIKQTKQLKEKLYATPSNKKS